MKSFLNLFKPTRTYDVSVSYGHAGFGGPVKAKTPEAALRKVFGGNTRQGMVVAQVLYRGALVLEEWGNKEHEPWWFCEHDFQTFPTLSGPDHGCQCVKCHVHKDAWDRISGTPAGSQP